MSEQIILEALEAAKKVLEGSERAATVKADGSLVTAADFAVEQAVREVLGRRDPGSSIFGEEHVGTERVPRRLRDEAGGWWAIDPIDGTTNYSRSIPNCAVSIGGGVGPEFGYGGIMSLEGASVFLGSKISPLSEEIRPVSELVVGFDYESASPEVLDRCFAAAVDVARDSRAVRVPGSVAIGMLWVALGRLDAYVHPGPAIWDYAAGAALVLQAGGVVHEPVFGDSEGLLLAGTGSAVETLLAILTHHGLA